MLELLPTTIISSLQIYIMINNFGHCVRLTTILELTQKTLFGTKLLNLYLLGAFFFVGRRLQTQANYLHLLRISTSSCCLHPLSLGWVLLGGLPILERYITFSIYSYIILKSITSSIYSYNILKSISTSILPTVKISLRAILGLTFGYLLNMFGALTITWHHLKLLMPTNI